MSSGNEFLQDIEDGARLLDQGKSQEAREVLKAAGEAEVPNALFVIGLTYWADQEWQLVEIYLQLAIDLGHTIAADALKELRMTPEYQEMANKRKMPSVVPEVTAAKQFLISLASNDKLPFKLPPEPWTEINYYIGPISVTLETSVSGFSFNIDLGQYSNTASSSAIGEAMVQRIPDPFPRAVISCGLQPQPRIVLNVDVPLSAGDSATFVEFVFAETADLAINLLKIGIQSGHLLSPSNNQLMQFGLMPPSSDHSNDPSAIRSASINWDNEFAGTKIFFNL